MAALIAAFALPASAAPYVAEMHREADGEQTAPDPIDRFAPRTSDTDRQIDYEVWALFERSNRPHETRSSRFALPT
jgi:hypothetical protein